MISERARQLRHNATEAERVLWKVLRSRQFSGYKFRRQHPIGRYIADFACIELRLMVEADGSQHVDNPMDEQRTKWLDSQGWKVLRFWNKDILSWNDSGRPMESYISMTLLEHDIQVSALRDI